MGFIDDVLGRGHERVSFGAPGGDPIVVDASIREVHGARGELSDHPVEVGVDIVDHYRIRPRELLIEAVITDTPITVEFPGASLINSAIGLINGDEKPSLNAWKEFERFFEEAVVLDIHTSLKDYTSMVLVDLSVVRKVDQQQALFFTATAGEVRFVTTEVGTALGISAAVSAITTGQRSTSQGNDPNTAADAAQDQKSSTLVQAFKGAGIL